MAVEKGHEVGEHEIVPKAKKKTSDTENRQQCAQARLEELKKRHATSYMSSQYRFRAEALEVGLHTSIDDLPQCRMLKGTKTSNKKPSELKEAFTELAKTLSDVFRTGHRTAPLTNSPLKQSDAVSPNVSSPLNR